MSKKSVIFWNLKGLWWHFVLGQMTLQVTLEICGSARFTGNLKRVPNCPTKLLVVNVAACPIPVFVTIIVEAAVLQELLTQILKQKGFGPLP